MRICQINTVYKSGSTGKIAKDLNDLIIKNDDESYIAYSRGEHLDKNCIKIGNSFDMKLHAVGTRIFDKHGLYSKGTTLEFIKEIDKLDIDIFHLHNIHGYYLHYPTLFEYLKKINKPVVWTLHDCWSFTGHCSYYEYIDCDKWQSECHSCPQLSQYPASLLFDNSKNNFLLKKQYFKGLHNLTIVTPSKWLAKEVGKSFLSEYNTIVINNGIDLDIFKPIDSDFRKKNNLSDKFLILGVASVWEERKGFKYFIELSERLKEDEQIILIGLNYEQIKSLPSNILGIKRTENQQELAKIYGTVDVFVNPTLEDNFPTTNLESLACGTPVITFESGGSPEIIDEKTGIIVEKENVNELYIAISKIKNNEKTKYSLDCVERAKKYFGKDERFQEYLDLYKKVIKGQH
jgi:glycosyltransferase involved in cell wall biosynthesis